jgi:hypothetical protein
MRVDTEVEALVREAFEASVAEDPVRFENALEAIAAGDELASRSIALAFSVDSAALYAIHQGHRPTDVQLHNLAITFAKSQPWTNLDAAASLVFLTSLADLRPPVGRLSAGDLALASFAMGGWLLSAFKLDEGLHWDDFLNIILDKLKSLPDA